MASPQVFIAGGLLAVLSLVTLFLSPAAAHEPLATPLEDANYSRPSSSIEISSYLAALAKFYPQARVETIGRSVLGRPLEALVLTQSGGSDVSRSDRVTVEIVGSQHGMEGAGAETLLFIARELLAGDLHDLLADVDVVLIPNSNPDGFELNRRVNANDVNLNTDFIALTQPESLALVKSLDRFQPEVVLDVHESAVLKKKSLALEGYMTDFMAQLEIANNPNIAPTLRNFALNDVLTPWVAGVDAAGFNAHRYFGEIRSSRQAVTNGGLSLQNFRNRTGIEGRLSFLMETRLDPKEGSYPTFRNLGARVARQRIGIERFLSVVHRRRNEILTALANARRQSLSAPLALDARYVARVGDMPVAINLKRISDGKLERIEFTDARTVATQDRLSMPSAYVVRAHQAEIKDLLERQGIRFETLTAPRNVHAVAFHMLHAKESVPVTAGATPTSVAAANILYVLDRVEQRRVRLRAESGDLWIELDQPRGRLVALMFEPQSNSSLYRTAAFQYLVEPGRALPALRIPQ